jgi:hypothetical protein
MSLWSPIRGDCTKGTPLFLEYLIKAFEAGKVEFFSSLESLRDRSSFLDYLAPSREAEWVVYAKRPFAGPEQVLDTTWRGPSLLDGCYPDLLG